MKLLPVFITLSLLSAAGFSALYDRVLYSPSAPAPERFTENPNNVQATDPSWTSRWTVGAKV